MTEMMPEDFETLLRFRTTLRHFLRWSEEQAREAGLTAAQHQLLLVIKGHPEPSGPRIGELADYLALRHHSAVELVDRAEKAGLAERRQDAEDHRVVRLRLTAAGDERIRRLSQVHLEELRRLRALLSGVFRSDR
jgi:DNA-binding MarR family transcriptional regulator